MRIGIDIRSLMEPRYSGVAEYTFNLLDNLFKIDRENEYLLFYNSFKDVKSNLPDWNYSNVKLVDSRWPNKIFNFLQKYLRWPKVDKLLGNVDIFFTPNWHFIALSKKCKKVITVHDLSFEHYPEFYSFKRKLWHRFVEPKKLLKQFDQIISVSENTKDDLVDLYKIDSEKVKVVYSGVKQDIVISDKLLVIREKYDLPDKFVLYLGTLEPRKNIGALIEAFSRLLRESFSNDSNGSRMNLVIAGAEGWLCKDIYKLARQSKCGDRIKFIGYVDPEDKPYIYQLASVFVYPSFYEGFGFPVLEAMKYGCPVITSLNSSLSEIVGDAALLVDPYNINDLKQAIKQVLVDEKLRNNLIEKGKERIGRFNWEKTAKEMMEIFNLVFSGRKG